MYVNERERCVCICVSTKAPTLRLGMVFIQGGYRFVMKNGWGRDSECGTHTMGM